MMLFAVLNAQADMLDKTGMAPWETCALCHSADGISVMSKFPKLAGQKAAYIEAQVLHFRHGRRTNDGGQMQAVTTEVEMRDLKEIAGYFAALPMVEYSGESSDAENLKKAERGKALFYRGQEKVPACATCHADKNSAAPWLDGQHRLYIEKQLRDFSEGRRGDLTMGGMSRIAQGLTEADMESVAMFLEMERLARD